MNDPILKNVPMNQIDLSDRCYIFTFEPPISEMVDSIKQIGLLNPPILEQIGPAAYRIVAGLRRIIALRHLGKSDLDARVFSGDKSSPDVNLFLLNLYENFANRKFNVIEKANILDRFIYLFKKSKTEVMEEYFLMLELGANELVLERYLRLVKSEDYLKLALFSEEMSMETVLTLMEMRADERKYIFHFIQKLKLGKNNQKEFIRLLHDIAKMNETTITEILDQPAIQKILEDEKFTLPVRAHRIKEILKQKRYPRLSEVGNRFTVLKKALKLPPAVNLRSSPFFEGDKYFVEFSFRNKTEFDRVLRHLNTIADSREFETLSELV